MATSTSALTALTGSDLVASDLVQVTDLSAGSSGTKKMTIAEFITGLDAQTHAFTNTVTGTDGVTSGIARKFGGGAFCQVAASSAILGTVEVITAFDQSISIPANTLKVGTRLRFRLQGIVTVQAGSETFTLTVKLGSVTLCSKAAIDPGSNDLFMVEFEAVCRTAGASGTIVGCGTIATGASGTAAANGVYLASTTIDTTGANILAAYCTWQASATDTNSVRLDVFCLDIIG